MTNFDEGQLDHVELFSPRPEETVNSFTQCLRVCGVTETEGQSVYLRAYEDFYHHTLKITKLLESLWIIK
jgi:catechol 2,3-dioxygenase